MLTDEMQTLIRNHSAGMVATVDGNGRPSVSPKATFVIVNPTTIAFGNIRSPGTIANIARQPDVEVCFIDVVLRKAVRVIGTASNHDVSAIDEATRTAFEAVWGDYLASFDSVVAVRVTGVERILSPAYDIGATEAELRSANLEKLNNL